MKDASGREAVSGLHGKKRVYHQIFRHPLRAVPAEDLPGDDVLDDTQVFKPLVCPKISDITGKRVSGHYRRFFPQKVGVSVATRLLAVCQATLPPAVVA